MISDIVANAIRSRFKTQIADTENLPTQYDNDPTEPDKTNLWCRLTMVDGDSNQVSLGSPGSNLHRTVGILYAQLFIPVGTGDKVIRAMAKKIYDKFLGLTDFGVRYKTPSIRKVGRDGSYWQLNVNCPFYTDDIG